MLETSDFVHGSATWSLSLVMSECSVSGRDQGHVSNFYILDLENFATASRRYTGDIHNSTVVGLFMTPETMEADSVASWLSAHCLWHRLVWAQDTLYYTWSRSHREDKCYGVSRGIKSRRVQSWMQLQRWVCDAASVNLLCTLVSYCCVV